MLETVGLVKFIEHPESTSTFWTNGKIWDHGIHAEDKLRIYWIISYL